MISKERVEELARAVRLDLTAEELTGMTVELGAMLEFAEQLDQVDVGATPEWTPPHPEGRALRADVPTGSLPREAALALAPTAEAGYFKVPRTLDEG